MNVGRREAVQADDLQRLLVERGLSPGDMGRVHVRDRMTFVSVRKEAVDRAVAALSGQVIGGRTVLAERARGGGGGGGAAGGAGSRVGTSSAA